MKYKIFIFPVAVLAFLFLAKGSSASYESSINRANQEVNANCRNHVWSEECQASIHKRDYLNNLRQLPRENDRDDFFEFDRGCKDDNKYKKNHRSHWNYHN